MRVEWFRLDLKDSQLVHLYEDHVDKNTDQSQSYRRRTKLNHQELQKGNASLKLSSVQISDKGHYKCFIQSKSWSDDATVDFKVEAVGRPPVITVDGFDHSGGLHLQCESEGWYPEPDLEWLNSEGVRLSSETTETHRNADRFSVKHTIIVHHSVGKIHCRVKLRHHMLETQIITTSTFCFEPFITSYFVFRYHTFKNTRSVVDIRLEWFRPDLKEAQLVHLYEDHEDRNTDQIESYRGRTELNHQELQRGNASLKLSSVQVSDEGRYKCFIQSKSWSDDATVDVHVEAVGTPPVITVDGFDDSGGLHLQCESKGWNPEPDLEWLNSEGVSLSSETTETHRNTDGFRVKHTIIVYERDRMIHCRVKMRHHMLDTMVINSNHDKLQEVKRKIQEEHDQLKEDMSRIQECSSECNQLVQYGNRR
ncbi:Butyrophilin-like protein 2 [Labeo rohita]|uniref:Butyrophilin-like protein 2 n=1 Tax=Labeo rohita TaxID=84645 RepID=A0ABQ8L1K2_LABRO|nr:Butyrophilin-like protein 2 [Labeo rohita]